MQELDLRGTRCPVSLMRLRLFMKKAPRPGEVIVKFDDEDFVTDLAAYCDKAGLTVSKINEQNYKVTLP